MFETVIHDEDGIVAWRRGTGGNIELTYILVKNKRQGEGRRLFARMLNKLSADQPYHTVYGFTRSDNEEAIAFYRSLGFTVEPVPSVYKDSGTCLFVAPYIGLVELNCA